MIGFSPLRILGRPRPRSAGTWNGASLGTRIFYDSRGWHRYMCFQYITPEGVEWYVFCRVSAIAVNWR